MDDVISDEERERLISELHRFLAWVGEQLPDKVDVDGKTIKVHDIIWDCMHRKEFSEQDKEHFMELIRLLETKEKYDEETLARANLTREEAKKLYHETASLIRALIDLRECEGGKVKLKESGDDIRKKIDDARRWLDFLKSIGKK
jgi:hypothetical protein